MVCSLKSKNNSTKGILNILEFSHNIYLRHRVGSYSSKVDC